MCLEILEFLTQNIITLYIGDNSQKEGMSCHTLYYVIYIMKFYEIFRKSKLDLYLYSLKSVSNYDTNYVSY